MKLKTEYFTTEEIDQVSRLDKKYGTDLLNTIYKMASKAAPGAFSLPRLQEVARLNDTTPIRRRLIRRVTTLTGIEIITEDRKTRKKITKKIKKKVIVESFYECCICCTGGVKVDLDCCHQSVCIACLGKLNLCPYCRHHL